MSLQAMLWASNLEVPASVKLVAMILGDHANTRHECWPAKSKVARRCSLSKGTVSRALKSLEEWGLIDVESREHENGKPRSNKYTLRVDRLAPPCAMDGSTIDPSPGDDEEIDDDTTGYEGAMTPETGGRVHDESIPRTHGESNPRTHSEPNHGLTVDPTNRTSHSEPFPLNPPQRSGDQPSASPAAPSRADPPTTANAEPIEQPTAAAASGAAQGSAGKGNEPDPNSEAFKRLQFEQLVNCWQQAGLNKFAGDEVGAWKAFRNKPLERRLDLIGKAPNYLTGKSAEFARWNATARHERSPKGPRPATVKDYVANELDRFVGTPSEPPPMPKAPPAGWIAAIASSKRSAFDDQAVFVQYPSDQFSAWSAAIKRAGCGVISYRDHRFGNEAEGIFTRRGTFFVSEWPPEESSFEHQPDQERQSA
jgi:DNA-binding transcriptional ArsR family regulator